MLTKYTQMRRRVHFLFDICTGKQGPSTDMLGCQQQFANSIPTFSALLKSMLSKNIIGLGVLIARVNSTPQIVYLLPQVRSICSQLQCNACLLNFSYFVPSIQAEVRDEETDVQIDPPCIWVIQVPYADDIRYPTVDECQSVVDIDGKSITSCFLGRNIVLTYRVQARRTHWWTVSRSSSRR